jgi:hypothetical protein
MIRYAPDYQSFMAGRFTRTPTRDPHAWKRDRAEDDQSWFDGPVREPREAPEVQR